ncbi:MAG: DUF3368 domain-containing protein [Thermodesulfobacteriota bacterium]
MIISNSSCLIILDKLGSLDLLQKLYSIITIPKAVKKEVFKSKPIPDRFNIVEITQPAAYRILEKNLGHGESEAITLSIELNADLLILDDLAARKIAHKLGIKITGVIGVLLEAKKAGLIEGLKPYLDDLLKEGFRVSKSVYEESLNLAGEKGESGFLLKEKQARYEVRKVRGVR